MIEAVGLRRSSAGALVLIVGLVAAACSGGGSRQNSTLPSGAAARPDVTDAGTRVPAPSACALPDLTSASQDVRTQVTNAYRDVENAGATHTPSGAGGEVGRHERPEYVAYVQLLVAAGYFDPALACLRHLAAVEPGNQRWPYMTAHVQLRKGDLEAAARSFAEVLSAHPDDEASLLWLADTDFDLGLFDEAQRSVDRLLARAPDNAAALYEAGRIAVARAAYTPAVDYLEHARRVDPQATAVNYPLAMAYRAIGREDAAAALLKRQGNVRPTMPDSMLDAGPSRLRGAVAFEQRGLDALRAQHWQAAIDEFREGLRDNPADPSLRYWLGTALYVSGDQDGAQREWRAVLAEDPAFARAHYSLGALYAARGQQAQARDAYAAAVKAAPNMAEARVRLGDTLVALGQGRDAMPEYEEAVRLDPSQADAWVHGARTLIALKQIDRARAWVNQARRVHPSNRDLADVEQELR